MQQREKFGQCSLGHPLPLASEKLVEQDHATAYCNHFLAHISESKLPQNVFRCSVPLLHVR